MAHHSRCANVLVRVLKYETRCEVWINNDNDNDDDDDDLIITIIKVLDYLVLQILISVLP